MFMFITNLTVDIMFPLFIVAPIKHKYHGGHHDISASTFHTWAKLAKVRKTKAWNSKLSGPWREALTWENDGSCVKNLYAFCPLYTRYIFIHIMYNIYIYCLNIV